MGLPPMAVSAPAGADRLWSQRGKLAHARTAGERERDQPRPVS